MLRILVVDDSATNRRLLRQILGADPEIEIVGEGTNGEEAIALCQKLQPDLITMDIDMPVMDGVEATRRIMVEASTPVVMVSGLEPTDVRRSMHALNAGAVAILAKPGGPGSKNFERDCRELVATVKAMAQVKLVRRWPRTPPYQAARDRAPLPAAPIAAIGLVASTGGPKALRQLLSALPATFPTPILIVQHIASGFAEGFASWLRDTTKRDIKIAVDGEPVARNIVYIAPDDRHLQVAHDRIVITATAPVGGFRPSGTLLFTSLAEAYGRAAIGVIMTGMGSDGVSGLRALRDAGGFVLAQDEASCDIFGMPGAALDAGVVEATTTLADLPARIVERIAARPA